MKKILILGLEGMLGNLAYHFFQEKGYEVRATALSDDGDYRFDVMGDIKELASILDDFAPDAVINCIGILNDVAEKHKALAVMANSFLPHYADELCRNRNIKFVHVSTDCVFDGKKGEYSEYDYRDATSFYGQSKALGEVNNDFSLTLRTSIVGPDRKENGIGLFQWFMNQTGKIKGYDGVIWTGVTTLQLVKTIEKALKNNLSGIRHAVNNDKISKYGLLLIFKKYFNTDVEIDPDSEYASNKSLVRTTDFDFEIPSYDQMIKEMSEWIKNHADLYPESQRPRL